MPAEASAGRSVSSSLGFLVDLVQLIPAIKLIRMTDADTASLPPSVHDLSIFRSDTFKLVYLLALCSAAAQYIAHVARSVPSKSPISPWRSLVAFTSWYAMGRAPGVVMG